MQISNRVSLGRVAQLGRVHAALPVHTLTPVYAGGDVAASTETRNDLIFKLTSGSLLPTGYSLAQQLSGAPTSWDVTSLTPGVATVAGNVVTRVGRGTANLMLKNGSLAKYISADFTQTPSPAVWTGFTGVSQSSRSSADILALMVAGKTMPYYATALTAASVTRSSTCWASVIDLTGSPVRTSLGGAFGTANSGALITPQHWVGVRHWGDGAANMGTGATLTFADALGTLYERTVLQRQIHPTRDQITCLLNSPLPPAITPFKLVGAGFKRPGTYHAYGMGWQITQEKNVSAVGYDLYVDVSGIADGTGGVQRDTLMPGINLPAHRLYGLGHLLQITRDGDSGGATGCYYNGQTCLCSLQTTPTNGRFFDAAFAPELNATIASLDAAAGISTGYTVGILAMP